jgi:glycerophosphoryl diester phosphodiesterase
VIDVQGHRGARGHLPENTLPGFAEAERMGAHTAELDVLMTRDGVLVVHHDFRLNPDIARGPDGQWVKDPPPIYSLTFAELQRYDVGRLRPGSEYAQRFPQQKPLDGARIPRLAELFAAQKSTRLRFNIEVKSLASRAAETPAPEPFARAVIAEVRKAGFERRAMIESFDFRIPKAVERDASDIPTAYLTERDGPSLADVKRAGARIWAPEYRALTREILEDAHRAGLRVIPWTVNENADIARLIDWGIDGMISDYPDRVLAQASAR